MVKFALLEICTSRLLLHRTYVNTESAKRSWKAEFRILVNLIILYVRTEVYLLDVFSYSVKFTQFT